MCTGTSRTSRKLEMQNRLVVFGSRGRASTSDQPSVIVIESFGFFFFVPAFQKAGARIDALRPSASSLFPVSLFRCPMTRVARPGANMGGSGAIARALLAPWLQLEWMCVYAYA